MEPRVEKEPRRRKSSGSPQRRGQTVPQKGLVRRQPVSQQDDVQVRIANRAYALYAERGYRQGNALDDWLEAEREILDLECHA